MDEKQEKEFRRKLQRARRTGRAGGLLQGICSMLTPDDVVIDCGANLGKISRELAATGAHVHAFEPDPYTFGKLTEALASFPNVTLHQAAVGTAAGERLLHRGVNFAPNPDGASVKSTLLAGGRGIREDEGIPVEVIDFPAFLRKTGPVAFLKMDIEGSELDLLEAMDAQDLFLDVRLTVAETHEKKFKELRPRFKALRERFSATYPITKVNLDWI